MLVEVKIPVVGESIVEVQIGQWLKSEGDEVRKDESLAVIDSEKATVELPAPESGKLTRILCQAGETVHVGTTIAQIESNGASGKPQAGESRPAGQPSPKAAAPTKPLPKAQAAPSKRTPAPPPTPAKKQPSTSPELATTQPAQPEEHPSETPVTEPETPDAPAGEAAPAPEASPVAARTEAAPQAQSEPKDAPAREEEVVPMSMLRRAVARRLVEAQHTMAMLTTFNEVDMSAVQADRKSTRLNSSHLG